jgi:flagellar hook assembly protein FlgD
MVSPYIGVLSIESETTPPTGGALKSENTYVYPNPFNPDRESATLRFSLSKSAKVTVKVCDAGGSLVTTLTEDEYMEAGEEQSLSWDGMNDKGDIVANGVYFCVITTDQGERAVAKVAVLR